MNLIKEKWNKEDGKELIKYLAEIKREDKIDWTRRISNTKMNLFGIANPTLKEIAKEITKGNYISYLDLYLFDYFDLTLIYAYVLNNIKDFNVAKKYLDKYASICDSWSSTDTLKVKVKNNEREYLELSKEYVKSNKPFVRRIGIIILFQFKRYNEYIDEILDIVKSLKDEEHYYVNMSVSWLLCELYIFHKNKIIELLKSNEINNFVLCKTISKCRDSYRISNEDKEMLLKIKKKFDFI